MKRIIRYFTSIIFIISGFVKTIDPKGFSFKLEEYFSPEVFNIPFLEDYALPLAIFVSVLEIILGLMLLMRIRLKETLITLISLCIFFAFLTFYSAYYNVVTDCGCFGDALKLEPWQSFWKDIFLLIMLVFIWKTHTKTFNIRHFKNSKLGILTLGILSIFYIAHHGITHEPLIDFRDYSLGTNLYIEKMKIKNDPSEYKTYYTLKNMTSGVEKEVDQDEYVNNEVYWKEGTQWKILEDKTTSKLIKKGYESEIAKFDLVDENGENKTMEILQLPRVVLIFSYKPNELDNTLINTIPSQFKKEKLVYGVSNQDGVFKQIPNLQMDATAIKTIARSNPFVLVLEKGKILEKKALKDV